MGYGEGTSCRAPSSNRTVRVPMDNLSSQEITRLWAENFPKRHGDRDATNILEKLVSIVLERAHEGEFYYTLRALGIPKVAFDQFRSEQKAV